MGTMTLNAQITYRKTQSGEWVAYGPAEIVRAGATITVTKRDGGTKAETVKSVGKPFQAGNRTMVYGYLAAKGATVKTTSSRGASCDECGRSGATHECVDSSGIAGVCCDRCARMSRYERSFA